MYLLQWTHAEALYQSHFIVMLWPFRNGPLCFIHSLQLRPDGSEETFCTKDVQSVFPTCDPHLVLSPQSVESLKIVICPYFYHSSRVKGHCDALETTNDNNVL